MAYRLFFVSQGADATPSAVVEDVTAASPLMSFGIAAFAAAAAAASGTSPFSHDWWIHSFSDLDAS